ncbi:MAG: Hint domain-containing protein [Planctomycetota bacterium]
MKWFVALLGFGAIALVAFFVFRSLDDSLAPPLPPVVRPTSRPGLVTLTRPLMSAVAPGDPVAIALRFAGDKEDDRYPYASQSQQLRSVHFDSNTSARSIRLRIRSAGVERVLSGGDLSTVSQMRGQVSLFVGSTVTFLVNGSDVRFDCFGWSGTHKWTDATNLESAREDVVLRLEGKLFLTSGQTVTFDSGAVVVQRRKAVPSIADTLSRATAVFSEHLGFSPNFHHEIVEDSERRRILNATVYGGRRWNEDFYVATVATDGTVEEITKESRSTCVFEGTRIWTEAGWRAIEELDVGDVLWSYNLKTQRRVPSRITQIRRGLSAERIRIGRDLSVTPTHPVYTFRGFVAAGNLRGDDTFLDTKGEHVQVRRVSSRSSRPARVFDISTSGPHNYFAGGLLVHNKKRAWSLERDDKWYALFEERARAARARTVFQAAADPGRP